MTLLRLKDAVDTTPHTSETPQPIWPVSAQVTQEELRDVPLKLLQD